MMGGRKLVLMYADLSDGKLFSCEHALHCNLLEKSIPLLYIRTFGSAGECSSTSPFQEGALDVLQANEIKQKQKSEVSGGTYRISGC